MLSENVKIIVYAIMNLLSLYTLDSAISIFLKRKSFDNKYIKFLPYILYFIIGIVTYFWDVPPYVNIIVSVLLVMIVELNFEGTYKKKVTLAFLWTLFKIIVELFIGLIYSELLNINLVTILNNNILNLIGTAYVVIVTLLIVKTVQLVAEKGSSLKSVTYMDSFQIWIIPICSIVILYAFIEMLLDYNSMHLILIVATILIVFVNVFFFYLFDSLKDTQKIKYENELLKNQSEYYVKIEESVNKSFDKISKIKHDLKYQLLYLKAITEENSVEALEEVDSRLNFLIGEVLTDDYKEYTKNQKLNRLLNYKLFYINENKIDSEVKISVSENAYFDGSDLYIILGNAIDNAVDNYNDEISSQKKVVIKITEDNKNIIIKISNPYNKKITFKNGLPATDKEDKSTHGIGLKSIKKIVEDKNGYFKINTNDNIFSLELLLFDEIK